MNRQPAAEEIERDIARAAELLDVAADELDGRGYHDAAGMLRIISSIDDVDEMAARLWIAFESAEVTERYVAQTAMFTVAETLLAVGDDAPVLRLTEILEQIATVYGLPGEPLEGAA